MKVKVRINLPKANNTLMLRYNTFAKAPYDKYFIASLIKNFKDQSSAFDLIDEMTGKGSLNEHYKTLYDEIKNLTESEIEVILKNSLYPIQKNVQYRYIYIPMLDISKFEGRIYKGNIARDDLFPRSFVEEGGTYVTHNFSEQDPEDKIDTYIANLTNEKIEIIVDNEPFAISQEDFQKIIVREDIDLGGYEGSISGNIEGNDWIQLSKLSLNNILAAKDYYLENGDHMAIYLDFVKMSSIAYSWGIHWLKEKTFKYDNPENQKICETVVNILMESGRINEFKTKSILDILKNINRDKQQEIINFILKRKDSKELTMVAFKLIEKGYEKGWNEETFKALYKFRENIKQLLYLYSIDKEFAYSIEDLLEIYKFDKTALIEKHKIQVNNYYNDCNRIKDSISKMAGEIINSAIRENIGKMQMGDNEKKFKNFINKYMAHNKMDIEDKNLNQLKQLLEKYSEGYELYKIVNEKWKHFKKERD